MVNIVLIDSDCLFQKAFTKMISEQKKCRLIGIAETKEEAIKIVENCYPQLIFLDIILEEKGDMGICKEIKVRCPEAAIYILSSYCNLRLLQKAMTEGVKKYFSKPISRVDLCTVINSFNQQDTWKGNPCIEELLSAVRERNYKYALEVNKKTVKKIMEIQSFEEKKEKFMYIVACLFSMFPEIGDRRKKNYIQKYELSSVILKNEILSCNWLDEIITEIFRYLCVTRYTYMGQVFQFIEKNANNEITLTQLSGQADISSGHLSRVFRKCYNVSIVDYVHLRKLHAAKKYMASSQMNISDISYLLGYNEAGYFCKIFKKYEGMTPTAFCQEYNENQ